MWRARCIYYQSRVMLSSSAKLRFSGPRLPSPAPLCKPKISYLTRSFIYSATPHCRLNVLLLSLKNGARDFRSLSSVSSSSHELEWKDPNSSSDGLDVYHEHLLEVQQEKQSRFIPVKAYFLCTSIDLRSLQTENAFNVIPPSSRATNYIVLRYSNFNSDPTGLEASIDNGSSYCYMVVFHYGSIVLFNVADHEVDGYLEIVKKHASGILPEMRKDDYAVVEKPTLETWMQGGLDYIMLKNLNIDGIRTIGSVLGQSIALDYYVRQVDGMVAEFTDINRGMEKTGTFTMQRKKLFQLVGKANTNLADVILKLGLFERSDIAWKNANYAQIWEYLRDEYELTQRFGSLDFKLKFVEHNIRFLQEILQNRKSDFLEWVIILLISVEILISLYNIIRESAISPS
ncbi:hypothetical protein AMTR_s00023p00247850 [Amborella trichopoda]|uniref:DUF155 domain-containing protein n=2 Tax=Amborella trichopoda TaxID=13333 RepID=W1NJY3_AMBTC|nr:hypothetical protein AMTR_s00023p00247850 [Amborella trichopoda]